MKCASILVLLIIGVLMNPVRPFNDKFSKTVKDATMEFKGINSTHLKIEAKVPLNSYLGVGFGNGMQNVDMIIF